MSYVQRRRFFWILFLGGLALLAVAASATTLSRLKLEDLAQESTAVARLRCLSATSQWEHGEIWTETRFEVLQREKGVLPGIVTVRLLGGHVGHLHSHVDEVPAFRTGEEVYLFLWTREGEPYQVLGWSQGTFRIARNRSLAWKWSRRIPPPLRFSTRRSGLSGAQEFAIFQWPFSEKKFTRH
jgi:hypothetical protein